jgi:hypothetical protein
VRIASYADKQKGWMYNDNGNGNDTWYSAICLLEELLTRANRAHLLKSYKKVGNSNGADFVEPPDELKKKLRFKTIERFGGKTRDLSKAVEESISTWVAKDKEHTDEAMNYDWPFNINSTLRICLHLHQHAIFSG